MPDSILAPYVRLRAYAEDEKRIFFGRERETTELLRLVESDSVSILYGVSGVGKSSLINAGLFPRLRDRDFLPVRVRLDHTEEGEGLTNQVLRAVDEAAELANVALSKRRPEETLWEYFHQTHRAEFWTVDHRLLTPVLALDQFEEFFTLGQESLRLREQGAEFREELLSLLENAPTEEVLESVRAEPAQWQRGAVPLRVLLIMREDFIAQLLPIVDALAERLPGIHRQKLRLVPLEKEAAREIIERPARALGIEPPDDAAAEAILARALPPSPAGERRIEPARLGLYLAAIETERVKRRLPRITPELTQIKGEDLFAQFVDETLFGLERQVRLFVEDVMVEPGGYRAAVTLDQAQMHHVRHIELEELAKRGLVTKRSGRPVRYELAHDLLCPALVHSRKVRLEEAAKLISPPTRRSQEQFSSRISISPPPSDSPDYFWDDLLDLIEERKVLPILGENCITFGEEDRPLYPWLARELAARLSLQPEVLPESPILSSVIEQYLIGGGEQTRVYTRLARILRDASLTPGTSLRNLASIDAFQLYLTTTFDPLLERALQEGRLGGACHVESLAFSPQNSVGDLPAPARDLLTTTVFHLFGRVSPVVGDYVAGAEDLIDFLLALPRSLESGLDRLSRELGGMPLLVLGLGYSDWVMRLLLRIFRRERLSANSKQVWIVEEKANEANMVLFFRSTGRNINVIDAPLDSFCAELATRWKARHPQRAREAVSPLTALRQNEEGLIFISYARQDEAAARQIRAALEAAGGAVWFDRNRLFADVTFDEETGETREQILRCAIFISVISAFTEASVESYFHRERNLAAQRAETLPESAHFYFPIIVDETSRNSVNHEPRRFAKLQRYRHPDGRLTQEDAARIVALQREYLARH